MKQWLSLLLSLVLCSVSYAGMDFTSMDRAMILPPDFKNTQEALKYGHDNKDNQDVIDGLYFMYVRYKKEMNEIRHKDLDAAYVLATKKQLCREALEVMGLNVDKAQVGASMMTYSVPCVSLIKC